MTFLQESDTSMESGLNSKTESMNDMQDRLVTVTSTPSDSDHSRGYLGEGSKSKSLQGNNSGKEQDPASRKRKKLPSCDSCKLRRVFCMPRPPPDSCPRCVEKGIVCTTTPVVRKKPTGRTGKRIEEAKAIFGTAVSSKYPRLAGPSNSPWIIPRSSSVIMSAPLPSTLQNGRINRNIAPAMATYNVDAYPTESSTANEAFSTQISPAGIQNQLNTIETNGSLVAHLLELFQALPQSWLPLFPRGKLSMQFEAAGRRLDNLPTPQSEVLVHTAIALTSRLSTHPLIIGPGPPAPTSFEKLTPEYIRGNGLLNLRSYGRRREQACQVLRKKAVYLSWERGTLVESNEDSMASCSLLEILEGRASPAAGRPYGSAFVNHLRALLNPEGADGWENVGYGAAPRLMNMSVGWSALIMLEALYSVNLGRPSNFTPAEDILLCGEITVSIEEAVMDAADDVDVRDAVTLFFRPMRPYTYHVARLARECIDKVIGTHNRQQPLNERYVAKFLTQLDHLYQLLQVLEVRIGVLLSPAAIAAHDLPETFEAERRYIMRACLYCLQMAWSSLSLPVYVDLRRRIQELKTGTTATMVERRRSRERLTVLLKQVHLIALRGARMVAQCLHDPPSLAFTTHLEHDRLTLWIQILLEAQAIEDDGEGITKAEREAELGYLLEGLYTMGWSWDTDQDRKLVSFLENALVDLRLNDTAAGDDQEGRGQDEICADVESNLSKSLPNNTDGIAPHVTTTEVNDGVFSSSQISSDSAAGPQGPTARFVESNPSFLQTPSISLGGNVAVNNVSATPGTFFSTTAISPSTVPLTGQMGYGSRMMPNPILPYEFDSLLSQGDGGGLVYGSGMRLSHLGSDDTGILDTTSSEHVQGHGPSLNSSSILLRQHLYSQMMMNSPGPQQNQTTGGTGEHQMLSSMLASPTTGQSSATHTVNGPGVGPEDEGFSQEWVAMRGQLEI